MADLSTIHTDVKAAIARGTAWDSQIPGWVRRAARWIERNNDLPYMKIYASFAIDADAPEPRLITLPTELKSFGDDGFVRIVNADGTFSYLSNLAPQTQKEILVEPPQFFWLSGHNEIWLNSTPEEDLSCEIYYVRYSTWPTLDTATHWLIDNAEDLLIAQTMVMMAPSLRDISVLQLWKGLRDEALATVVRSGTDMQYTNAPETMHYGTT